MPLSERSFLRQDYAKQYGYCIAAVEGFFKSITLSSSHSLQDTLRLLTLWFDHGQDSEVNDALIAGLKTIQIDNWLQVTNNIVLLN